jgi:hypothetical protein
MIEIHERIDAFVHRDWRALKRFNDIPWNEFRKLWEPPAPGDEEQDIVPAPATPEAKPKAPPKRRAPRNKPTATKDNPTPPKKLSAAEIRARQFQENVIDELNKASGFSSD